MRNKKYKILKDSKHSLYVSSGHFLYRIKALKTFGNVTKGDIGGYIGSQRNLSQEGNCWVFDNAKVLDNAIVDIYAEVHDNAVVSGNARVTDCARVCDNAQVSDNAQIWDNAQVTDNARVRSNAQVLDNAQIWDNAQICGNATISGNAKIYDDANVRDKAEIRSNAVISDSVIIFGNTVLQSSANIQSSDDYLTIGPIGSRRRITTFYRTEDDLIYVSCGCFNNNIDKFEEAVIKTHGDNKFAKEYLSAIAFARTYFDINKGGN